MSQRHLIDQILDDLHMNNDTVNTKPTSAASSKLLTRHTDSKPFDNSFNYRSVIGKQAQLVGKSDAKRHFICGSPVCKICCIGSQTQAQGCSQMVGAIPEGNPRQRYNNEAYA